MSNVRVRLAPGGFLPQAFKWEGRSYRVLAVHSVKVYGAERRYRVATADGYFELAVALPGGAWRVRRWPNSLSRALYRLQHGPRYPLPAWRRRRALPARVAAAGHPRVSAPRVPAPVANRV